MKARVKKIRKAKFMEQQGRCFYCLQPMWEEDGERTARIYGLSALASSRLRSTAEHLVAQQDGGADIVQNIVAACCYCNRTRHRTPNPKPPTAYAKKVRNRLWKGKWHGIRIVPVFTQ